MVDTVDTGMVVHTDNKGSNSKTRNSLGKPQLVVVAVDNMDVADAPLPLDPTLVPTIK